MRKQFTGFFLETLLLIIIFIVVILVLTQVFGLIKAESVRARQLTDAVTLASSAAEEFAASADSLTPEGERTEHYDRTLTAVPSGEYEVRSSWHTADNGIVYCTIEVFCGEKPVPIYTIETAAYRKEAAE